MLIHKMRLKSEPFEKIKSGAKTIELRLNDEKRQQVKVGDFIEFTLIDDSSRKLTTRVTALHKYNSFRELFSELPYKKLGLDKVPEPDFMDKFYSVEEQEKYGALGIELRMTDLQKFLDAQENGYSFGSDYKTALSEIRNGMKISHWIWYIFPQIKGLGISSVTAYFSINNLNEAVDYIQHSVLCERLVEISSELLKSETNDLMVIFGDPDAFKVRSCMTLFKYAAPELTVFQQVLDRFCNGTEDYRTVEILGL